MFEKVNLAHPDKIADRIAGAIVDLAYSEKENPKVAVEVLIGHGNCKIITESNINFADKEHQGKVFDIVDRIVGEHCATEIIAAKQDEHLAKNQVEVLRCGDNGIFKGCVRTEEESILGGIARNLYNKFKSDGKYIIDNSNETLIVCQSKARDKDIKKVINDYFTVADVIANPYMMTINPLGEWTGGIDVDIGATNRKLGSDMGRAVTGGGLHGKDLSKADVAVNIYCYLLACEIERNIKAKCAIGADSVLFIDDEMEEDIEYMDFNTIVKASETYINKIGGFEKFAEWGLI